MTSADTSTKFHQLLREQVRNEFTASQQYVAVAVYFDDADLPQLAAHFYAQAIEERNHAMMMIQYLLDNDIHVVVPGVDTVQGEFATVREPVALAAAAGEGGDRADHPARAHRPRRGRLPRRAVHAVVPARAGRRRWRR